jgi:5,10-methylenetetrahydromethanopterin reductase
VELSCAFPPGPDVVDHVLLAEELGYERAWVYDSPGLYGDVWVQLALCARATNRIGLGPGVLVPSLRHPIVNAAAAAQLAQLAPGRTVLGIGTGFTGRYVLGQPPLTWAETEEYVGQLMALMRGDAVDVDGAPVKLVHPPGHTADRPLDVPVILGANGPKGLAAAARLGVDGIVSIFGGQPGWARSTLLMYGTVLDDGETADAPRVLDAAGPGAAVVFHAMYEADPALLDGMPGGPEWRASIERFPERERHLHTHELHLVGLSERDRAVVTGDLVAGSTWTGTAGALRERVEAAAASGVTELMYAPMGSDVERELRSFRAVVD